MKMSLKMVSGLGLLALVALGINGCGSTIPPGHVGIVVDKYGSQKGVQDLPVKTGWVGVNPFTEYVIEYPVFVQTVQWTASKTEGNPYDESITFTADKGVVINADIALSYKLNGDAVPAFYTKYRVSNINDFTYGYMRNVARDAFNEVGGHYPVEDIVGNNEQFITVVRKRLTESLSADGVEITQLGFISNPRPPEAITHQINSSQQAKYLAQQKVNEVQQATADGQKRVAYAKAEVEANELLSKSITPQLLELRKLELQRQQIDVTDRAVARWNGQYPTTMLGGGGQTLFNIPAPQQGQK
jgi:regulator of protease activity HflC (stomatin/prohibitin superfamily)